MINISELVKNAPFKMLLALFFCPVANGTDYFVDDKGSGANGLNWADAKTSINDALTLAKAGDTIWVDGDVFMLSSEIQAKPGITVKGDPANLQNPALDKSLRSPENGYSLNYPVLFGGKEFSDQSWTQEGGDPVYWSTEILPSVYGVFTKTNNWDYKSYRKVTTYANCVAVPNSYWQDVDDIFGHGPKTVFVHTPDGGNPDIGDNIYYGQDISLVTLSGASNFKLENLYMVGSRYGIRFINEASTGVTLEKVTMQSMFSAFLDMSASIANDNIYIKDGKFLDLVSGEGIKTSPATKDLELRNNVFARIANSAAIKYRGSGEFIAIGNSISDIYGVGDTDDDRLVTSSEQSSGDTGHGIFVTPANALLLSIRDNDIQNCVGRGIVIRGYASWNEVTSNSINNTKRSGIYYNAGGPGEIIGNLQNASYAGQGIVVRQNRFHVDVIGNIAKNNQLGGFATYMTSSSSGENGDIKFISNSSWGNSQSAFIIGSIGDGIGGDPRDKVYLYENNGYSDAPGGKAISVNGSDIDSTNCAANRQCYKDSTPRNVILDRNNWYVYNAASTLGSWMGSESGPGLPDWQLVSGQDANSQSVPPIQETDGDGIPDDGFAERCTGGNGTNCNDNCLTIPNRNQADGDADGVGDLCDNYPAEYNPDQQDPGNTSNEEEPDVTNTGTDNTNNNSVDEANGAGSGAGSNEEEMGGTDDRADNTNNNAIGANTESGSGGGGGCTVSNNRSFDPWALIFLVASIAGILHRRTRIHSN